MFKIIKTKEYQDLIETNTKLGDELVALRRKMQAVTSRDLIREVLRIFPYNSKVDPQDPRYQDPAYLKRMADLADNQVLKEELSKIVHESIENIATMSPKNPEAEMVMTGNINACDIIMERLNSAKVYLEDQKNNL